MSRDRCPRRGYTDGAGFTILEVVVALAIAALALVTLFQTASGGLFAADTAARIDEAIERAESHLAAFGRAGAVAPGQSTGDDGGGYQWQMRATPIARQPAVEPIDTGKQPNERQQGGPRLVLYDIEVTISWRGASQNRSVVLETRRLGTAPGPD